MFSVLKYFCKDIKIIALSFRAKRRRVVERSEKSRVQSFYASEILPPYGRLDDNRQNLSADRIHLLEDKRTSLTFASEKNKRIE